MLRVGQLEDKNYEVKFKNKVYTILDNSPQRKPITRVERVKNRMYPLTIRSSVSNSETDYVAKSHDQSWLWHLRYVHLYFGGLKMLQRKHMVKGFPCIKHHASSCESCIL